MMVELNIFLTELPKKIEYSFDPERQKGYLRKTLYDEDVVMNNQCLYTLSRYGLGNYIDKDKRSLANVDERTHYCQFKPCR
jgi:hypothetical protein